MSARRAAAPRAGERDAVRGAAYAALLAFDRRPENAEDLVARFAAPGFDARDRAFLREMVYGVLRWRSRLDAAYGRFLNEPADRLTAPVREALRLGAYQILFLDRVPDHSAVDTSVALAGRRGAGWAAGLINAVLRRVAREPLAPPGAIEERLEVWESHPGWLVRRWLARLGPEGAAARCAADNAEAPLVLRANPERTDAAALARRLAGEGVPTAPGAVDPDCLRVDPGAGRPPVPLTETAAFAAGEFIVQDEAASLAARFAGAGPGDRVLDLCAAPGGKTAVLAWAAGPGGGVVAADASRARIGRLVGNCARIGAPARFAVMDAANPACRDAFDLVVVDAPCSGLGVLRRHPDARWRLAEDDLARQGDRQGRLLAGAARAVRPGGRLVYSVCSNEPEETDAVAAAFAAPGFAREAGSGGLPPSALRFVDGAGALRIGPEDGLDGFFAARWRRGA